MKFFRNKSSLVLFISFGLIIIFVPYLCLAIDASSEQDILYPLEAPIGNVYLIKNLVEYFIIVYNFAVSAAGILAVVVIMFGGMNWAMSAGNEQKITAAKETIISAIIGLVLVLGSYVILNFISPRLIDFDIIVPEIELFTPEGLALRDLVPCTEPRFKPTCGNTPCGTPCLFEGEACRGVCCSKECADAASTDIATTGFKDKNYDLAQGGCYPSASDPLGSTGSYKCQLTACGQTIENYLKTQPNIGDANKRDNEEVKKNVLEYLCSGKPLAAWDSFETEITIPDQCKGSGYCAWDIYKAANFSQCDNGKLYYCAVDCQARGWSLGVADCEYTDASSPVCNLWYSPSGLMSQKQEWKCTSEKPTSLSTMVPLEEIEP